jgi:small subunit ribosomal protein S16
MLIIRLSKTGSKNKPFYRIVAIDKEKKVTGKNISIIGFFNPKTKESKIDINEYKRLTSNGAQVSLAVKKLLEK